MTRISRYLIAGIAFAAASYGAGPNLDIVGFKIGMSEEDAVAALKPHNARFYVNQPAIKLEGIAEPVKPVAMATASASASQGNENMTLLFTLPPSKKVLWGIQRVVGYVPDQRPSLDATLNALRQKYGPESIPPVTNSGVANLVWVFDANGNLLSRAQAMGPYMRCTTILQNHFINNDQDTFNNLQQGIQGARLEANTL